jgi:Fic family protein
MSAKVEEQIEKMIEEKLGLYQPRNTGRRTANEIRDQIQYELEKRPKTTHELKNSINAKKPTVENHCNHLESLNVVKKIEIESQEYWKLKSYDSS